MKSSIYDELGGFVKVRQLISVFYDYVLEHDELASTFEHVNMERLIDHQTKFFAMLLGGPLSISNLELQKVHERLNITNHEFNLTKDCLDDALDDFDLSDEHVTSILSAFESKRTLIVKQ